MAMPGAFILVQKRLPVSLFTFPSLMTCLCQKLSVFVLSHFFSTLFNNTSQFITSFAVDRFFAQLLVVSNPQIKLVSPAN